MVPPDLRRAHVGGGSLLDHRVSRSSACLHDGVRLGEVSGQSLPFLRNGTLEYLASGSRGLEKMTSKR